MASIFADIADKTFDKKYHAELLVYELHGGIPADPNKATGWIASKMGLKDEMLQDMVVKTMEERGTVEGLSTQDVTDAAGEVADLKQLNGFKRCNWSTRNDVDVERGADFEEVDGQLCIEGRQVKAMLKEAASIAVAGGHLPSRGWGKTNKGLLNFLAEHIFVLEDKIPLGVVEPSGISQRFVHTWRGSGIQMEEYVTDAKVSFTVATDFDWPDKFWPTVWVIAEKNGLGASRSTGVGTFEVQAWDRL
jgi:hypothetical protein